MSDLFAIILGSYLVGSIPFAYLVVRLKSRTDVRAAGSGKAGAFNAYTVTNSRPAGLLVGFLDALKGFAAVYLTSLCAPGSFWFDVLALLMAVTGHVYPIWTKFKGGRGLATTAGGMFRIGLPYTVAWCLIWGIARLLRREILWSNIAAILLAPVLVWIVPWELSDRLMFMTIDRWSFLFFSCLISFVLLLSHTDALKDVWRGSSVPEKDISPS